ncbi:TonB-dependent receptor plug domain-containing protein [Sphingobacterium kyonggiense]
MKSSRNLLLLLITLTAALSTQAQQLEKSQKILNEYANNHPQEKLHMQTDRNVYAVGETIWYKLYSVIGMENRLSVLSNVAYIELINPAGKIVDQKINALYAGVAVGEMALADSLVEGSYRLRAYTNWMRNNDEDYFFEKVINIGNVRSDNIETKSTTITENGQEFYVIQLANVSGAAMPKTKISYEFKDGEKVVDRGREDIDQEGRMKIKVTDKNKGKLLFLSFTNPDKRKVQKTISTKSFFSENSIQAFPEGGHLLADELNRIAFKAINPQGKGIKAKIYILANNTDTAATLETNSLGMASVPCYLNKGTTYTVQAHFADNTQKTINLPAIENSGYSISVNQSSPAKIFAQVNISQDKVNNEEVYFVLHHLGNIYYIAKQKASNKNVLFSIGKDKVPTGVMTISIMNKDFLPLVERVIFNLNNNRIMPLTIAQDKDSYGKRSKVTNNLTLDLGSSAGTDTATLASLSASVINLTKYGKDLSDDVSILSSLYLNADLKGFIEKPAYYFNADGTVKTQELDDLLLTQGWRKIDWKQLDSLNNTPKYPIEKGLRITGMVKKLGRKAPAANAKVQLISTRNFMDFLDTTANAKGEFEFDKLLFPDSVKFLVSAQDEKGKKNIDITYNKPSPADVNLAKNDPLIQNDVNASFREQLLAGKRFYQQLESKGLMDKVTEIEEVVVTVQRPKVPDNSTNLNGPGNADQVITADDLSTCTTLEMCLAGRLMGVVFQGGKPMNTRGNVEMQVVLDGMYVESDMLSTINPQDVASVEVLRNINYTSIYGSYGGNGLIVITSKTGRDASRGNFQPRGLLAIQPKGISLMKEYYKPEYDVDSNKQFDQDLRMTIHWEPGIVTDDHGKASFNFFTSDEIGTYRMIIEGLDVEGRLIRKVIDFEVK